MSIIARQHIQNIDIDEVFQIIYDCYCSDKYIPGIIEHDKKFKGVTASTEQTPDRHLHIELTDFNYLEEPISLHFKSSYKFLSRYIQCDLHIGRRNRIIISYINFNKLKLKCVKSIKNQLIKQINKINKLLISIHDQIAIEKRLQWTGIKPIMTLPEQLAYKYGPEHVGSLVGEKTTTKADVGQIYNKLVSELKHVQNHDNRYVLVSHKEYDNYTDTNKIYLDGDSFRFDLCKFIDKINQTKFIIYISCGYVRIHPLELNTIAPDDKDILNKRLNYLSVNILKNTHLRDNVASILLLINRAYEIIEECKI